MTERFLSSERAACSQLKRWKAARRCTCSSPKGCFEQRFGLLHKPAPQNTTQHMRTLHSSRPALSLLCASDVHCLSAHLRLVSPFPHLMYIAVVHMRRNVSGVLLYFFGIHLLFCSWYLHFKNAKDGYNFRGQICQSPSLSATSSFSSKDIMGINERLFIAGTKCSDMPEMSKRYYAPLKGPLFRDKNDNFMPLQWNHKYHFKPRP